MKKLTTDIHKFMDIEACEMPKGLMEKLRRKGLFTYRDTVASLNEHLYSTDTLKEYLNDNPKEFTPTQKTMIKRILRLLDKEDVGYFRFVFN